jgi:hypothetical protein
MVKTGLTVNFLGDLSRFALLEALGAIAIPTAAPAA